MSEESSYFIVLKNPESFDLQRLADTLASSLSMLRVDAIMHLKNYWGLLHKTDEMGKAQELQERLMKEGVETFVLHSAKIKQLPEVKVLKKASLEQHGLVFEGDEQEKSLPWDNFVLLGAGQVIEIEDVKKTAVGDGHYARHLATTGVSFVTAVRISANRLKGKEVVERKTGTTYVLDLIAREDSESIRIIGNSFNYSCLGDKMEYNMPLNFKNLYQVISMLLPNIIRNQGARAIDNDDMAKMKYSGESNYDHEMLWLMQLTGRETPGIQQS